MKLDTILEGLEAMRKNWQIAYSDRLLIEAAIERLKRQQELLFKAMAQTPGWESEVPK